MAHIQWVRVKKKIIFLIVIVGIIVFAIVKLVNLVNNWTPPCVYDPAARLSATPRPFEANKNSLTFLSDQDKQKIYDAIDSAKDPGDLDTKLYTSIEAVLELHQDQGEISSALATAPEFMSDNPKGITITSGGCSTNLLEGVDLSPIKKDDMPTLKSFAKLFVEETSKYPLAWWEKAMPPFIVFVKAVKVQGEIVGGIENGAVIYNISSINIDREATRPIIHHELMHWAEQLSATWNDKSWPGMSTDYTEKYDLNPNDILEHPAKGFVTSYAKTNSLEDKAEVYSYLFTKEGVRKLNEWTRTDQALAKKVNYIKKFIKDRVNRMDDKYFQTYILGN